METLTLIPQNQNSYGIMRDIQGPQDILDLCTEKKIEQEHDKLWSLGDAFGNSSSKLGG